MEDHFPFTSTFGHQKAALNRVSESELQTTLDIDQWPAVFVYDILQLPGTLAAVLGHASSMYTVRYMTPAQLVPAHERSNVWRADSASSIHGMIVLGRGGSSRRALAEFYGENFKRQKINVRITLSEGHTKVMMAYMWIPREGYGATMKRDDDRVNGSDETDQSDNNHEARWDHSCSASGVGWDDNVRNENYDIIW